MFPFTFTHVPVYCMFYACSRLLHVLRMFPVYVYACFLLRLRMFPVYVYASPVYRKFTLLPHVSSFTVPHGVSFTVPHCASFTVPHR